MLIGCMVETFFYAPLDRKILKKEREKARVLRKSNWWQSLLAEGLCYYCQEKFTREELTMDHKVPIARGGKSSKSNIVPCCKECNTQKKSQTAAEMAF